jgi:hypothetical protein
MRPRKNATDGAKAYTTLSAKQVLDAITAFHSLPPDAKIEFKFKLPDDNKSRIVAMPFDGVDVSYECGR